MNALSLGYHEILDRADCFLPPDILRYCLDRTDFRRHLCAIHEKAQGSIETIAGSRSWEEQVPVFLTFDDGNTGAYECAAADLEQHNWRGHFFVTTDWIGRRGFMDKSQIRELHDRGHVIGSHSCSHPPRMSALSIEELLEEWGESCARLSDIIGDRVVVASVADGYYSDKVGQAAATAGIQVLFTSEPTVQVTTVEGCLVLGRYIIRRGMPPSTSGAIAAGWVWPRWRQTAEWQVKQFAKAISGRHYLTVRQHLLERGRTRMMPAQSQSATPVGETRLGERILLALSRAPEAEDRNRDGEAWELDTALSLLKNVYPQFASEIVGSAVLDFGCGFGWQVLAMACCGAHRSVGIESDATVLQGARDLARKMGFSSPAVEFRRALGADLYGEFDLVISQNAVEHFPDPVGSLKLMSRALKPGGRVLITFGPPWLAPYGSHMDFFTKVPWVNVVFSERTVMAVRRRFRDDGATRYHEIRKGLNRMTLHRFERLVAGCAMRPVYWRLECVKGLNWLARIPLLREFFVSHVTCLLAETARAPRKPTMSRPRTVAASR